MRFGRVASRLGKSASREKLEISYDGRPRFYVVFFVDHLRQRKIGLLQVLFSEVNNAPPQHF